MAADYTRVWGDFHGAVGVLLVAVPHMVDADLEALASEASGLIEEIEAEQRAREEVKRREHPSR